jgi:hypothetical protein
MKKLFIGLLISSLASCSSPYCTPNTDKAFSEREQVELLKKSNELQAEQNKQLTRIADALEKK